MSLAYALARPFLFALPPEAAHRLTLHALRLMPAHAKLSPPALHVSALGLSLDNPLGLAAGFDKNAEAVRAALGLGFGFVEAGTLTPQAQSGNPRPRLFRLREDKAIINRLGFNNQGFARAAARLARLGAPPGVVGVNVGASRDSRDPIADYVQGYEIFSSLAHYVAVNISSPNTPGLRRLQARAAFEPLAKALAATRARLAVRRPILLKIAPDLDEPALADIVEIAIAHGLNGLILTNTTVACREGLKSPHAREEGGLSGKPLFALSTKTLARAARLAQGKLVLVGLGGVESGADAYAKIRAGASLVALYTGLVYHGPGLVARIKRELAQLLARDGFSSVKEAVGADLR